MTMYGTFCLDLFFFFNDTATTEIYTLSLHDALPILRWLLLAAGGALVIAAVITRLGLRRRAARAPRGRARDRKSTRLNSSHSQISYAVFCLKKKNIASRVFTSAAEATSSRDRVSASA